MTKTPDDIRRGRKVLRMVAELHVRGYQRLRIAPGMAPSGCYWRCSVAPVLNVLVSHGARLADFDGMVAHYSSGMENRYFDWQDSPGMSPSWLADRFIERFPRIVAEGKGRDWLYAGWLVEILHLTYPDVLPIAYADWELPENAMMTVGARSDIHVPLPPPGEANPRRT
jgi:hypothetical protein